MRIFFNWKNERRDENMNMFIFHRSRIQWLNSAGTGWNGVPPPVSGVPPPELTFTVPPLGNVVSS